MARKSLLLGLVMMIDYLMFEHIEENNKIDHQNKRGGFDGL